MKTDDYNKVKQITSKLDQKLNKATDIFTKISSIFNQSNENNYETIITSCKLNETIEDRKQKTEIVNFIKNQTNNLYDFLYKIKENTDFTKNEWFLSSNDLSGNDCSNKFDDSYIRSLYISSIKSKRVIILINNGRSLNDEQLDLSKSIARFIIEMLSVDDQIGLLTIAGITKSFKNDFCGNLIDAEMHSIDSFMKKKLIKFIDEIVLINESTNHSIGFEYSFKIIKENMKLNEINPTIIVYLTPSIDDDKIIFETILTGQKQLYQSAVVNTIEIMSYKKNILSETTTGFYKRIDRNDRKLIKKIVTEIFTIFFIKKFINNKIVVHPPITDINSNDVIVSMTQTIENFGIFGIDLFLSDLVEDITYHNHYNSSYAFITDLKGLTVMHPSFSRPINQLNNYSTIHIKYLENYDFRKFFKKMQILFEGNETIYQKKQMVSQNKIICLNKKK